MDELVQDGKGKFKAVALTLLGMSLYVIISYHVVNEMVDQGRLVKQVVRFGLEILLLILIYRGVRWARLLFSFLLGIGVIGFGVLLFMGGMNTDFVSLILMIVIYSNAIYAFNFSPSVAAFMKYQRNEV